MNAPIHRLTKARSHRPPSGSPSAVVQRAVALVEYSVFNPSSFGTGGDGRATRCVIVSRIARNNPYTSPLVDEPSPREEVRSMRRGRAVLYVQSAFALICGIGGVYEYFAFVYLGLPSRVGDAIAIVLFPAVFIALIGNIGCPLIVLRIAINDHLSWGRGLFGLALSITLTVASCFALLPLFSD